MLVAVVSFGFVLRLVFAQVFVLGRKALGAKNAGAESAGAESAGAESEGRKARGRKAPKPSTMSKDLESEEKDLPGKRFLMVDVWAFKFENNWMRSLLPPKRFVFDGGLAHVCISFGCATGGSR